MSDSMSTSDPFALVDTFYETKHATHDMGKSSRTGHPGSGWCLRCGMTHHDAKMHGVRYSDRSGMSPLCEECWKTSTGPERVEYCRALFRSWLVGALNCAWSRNVAFREDHDHWQKILRYLEESGEGAEIPAQMWTAEGVKKTWRGTWWKPWTWSRGWLEIELVGELDGENVTFKFDKVRASATELLGTK